MLSLQFASFSLMVRNCTTPLRLQGHGVVEVSSVSLTFLLTAIHKHNDSCQFKAQALMSNTTYPVAVVSGWVSLGFCGYQTDKALVQERLYDAYGVGLKSSPSSHVY